MSDSRVECAACHRPYHAALPVCPFCAARRDPASTPAMRPPARPPPTAAPEPGCPRCGGAPGSGTVALQTREFKEVSLLRMRTKYLVRTVQVPGFCDDCARAIEKGRYVADALTLLPAFAMFVATLALESAFPLGVGFLYVMYVARNLTYHWADFLVYGGRLELQLESFTPPGDRGTTRLPVSTWHILVRVGCWPALGVVLALLVAGIAQVVPKPTPAPAATAGNAAEQDPQAFLAAATHLSLPLAPRAFETAFRLPPTPLMESRVMGGRTGYILTAYASGTAAPAQTWCELVTGPQLLARFLAAEGDILVIQHGAQRMALDRYHAKRLAAALPPADAGTGPMYRTE